MGFLTLKAVVKLVAFDFFLAEKDFSSLRKRVQAQKIGAATAPPNVIEIVCSAVDIACVWYWKRVLCLQRAATITCLLREFGIPASLIIGAQQLPFKAHAWVEVHGKVIHERTDVCAIYSVLDRI